MTTRKANRREFFRQSAAVAGAAPMVTRWNQSTFGRSEIRCAMIGTGGRGRSVLQAVKKVSGVRVAALCDISSESLDKALEIVGDHQPKTYTFHQDLLSAGDIDAVLVETPPHLHREHVVETLRAGYHCSAAKPLALTVNELDEIRAVAGTSRGILHVDQQLRYRPQYTEGIARIHKGEIGYIGFVRAQRYSNWDGQPRDYSTLSPKNWLYRIEQSGDTIVENQIHNIDIINWIMDSHPIRATGLGGQNMIKGPGNELMDNYGLTFEYPDDRYAIFSKISYAMPDEFTGTFIHAYGEKAAADVSYAGAVRFVWRGKTKPTVIDASGEVDMNYLSILDFFQAIRDGRQPFADVEIGRDAALTTLLGRKAVYEKRTITWDELLEEGAPPRPAQAIHKS